MTVDDKEYIDLVKKVAKYESALQVISTITDGAYMDIDGWRHLACQASNIATKALEEK